MAGRIDLADMEDAIDQAAEAEASSQDASAIVIPSQEYIDDVMSITSHSVGGSMIADAPEDEEASCFFAVEYTFLTTLTQMLFAGVEATSRVLWNDKACHQCPLRSHHEAQQFCSALAWQDAACCGT